MSSSAASPTTPITGRNARNDWWKSSVIYQIYPRSFVDSNGDGVGDLPGILEKMDYLQELGVDALWLSPFYPSPQYDHGYDVADYFDVNPDFGTIHDIAQVIDRAHARGMRVIIDIVPNHSSSEHAWFQEALKSVPGSPERDRYYFRFSGDEPPNNWRSVFGGPAWSPVYPLTEREDDKGWWYLHLFDPHQPDWNWDNADVWALFEEILRFWCDMGVDGFRVDVAHGLVKAAGLPDTADPDIRLTGAPAIAPYFDQEGVHDIYRHWRTILDEYGPDKMMVAEAWLSHPERSAQYVREDEMNHVFNFDILYCGWNPEEMRQIMAQTAEANERVGAVNTWVLSNHDVVRHSTRLGYPYGATIADGIGPADPQPDATLGLRRALAMTTFLLGLPGAMYLYNGEELGLPEATTLRPEDRVDPTWERSGHRILGRDGARVPLPWAKGAANAGFSSGKPWLPQPEGWEEKAVSEQVEDPTSPLHHYRTAIELRHELGLGEGNLEIVDSHPDLLLVRNDTTTLAMNMGPVDLPVPLNGEVMIASNDQGVRREEDSLILSPNTSVWIAD